MGNGTDELLAGSDNLEEANVDVTHALGTPAADGVTEQSGIQQTDGVLVVSQTGVQLTAVLRILTGHITQSVIGHLSIESIVPLAGELLESDDVGLVVVDHGEGLLGTTGDVGTPRVTAVVGILTNQHVVGHKADVGAGGHGLGIGANITGRLIGIRLVGILSHHEVVQVALAIAAATAANLQEDGLVLTGVKGDGSLLPHAVNSTAAVTISHGLRVAVGGLDVGSGLIAVTDVQTNVGAIHQSVVEADGVVGVLLHSHSLGQTVSVAAAVGGHVHREVTGISLIVGSGHAGAYSPTIVVASLEVTVDDVTVVGGSIVTSGSIGLIRSLGLAGLLAGLGHLEIIKVVLTDGAVVIQSDISSGGSVGREGNGHVNPLTVVAVHIATNGVGVVLHNAGQATVLDVSKVIGNLVVEDNPEHVVGGSGVVRIHLERQNVVALSIHVEALLEHIARGGGIGLQDVALTGAGGIGNDGGRTIHIHPAALIGFHVTVVQITVVINGAIVGLQLDIVQINGLGRAGGVLETEVQRGVFTAVEHIGLSLPLGGSGRLLNSNGLSAIPHQSVYRITLVIKGHLVPSVGLQGGFLVQITIAAGIPLDSLATVIINDSAAPRRGAIFKVIAGNNSSSRDHGAHGQQSAQHGQHGKQGQYFAHFDLHSVFPPKNYFGITAIVESWAASVKPPVPMRVFSHHGGKPKRGDNDYLSCAWMRRPREHTPTISLII